MTRRDVDVRDLSGRECELLLDERHQRRTGEPGEEADEEGEPREMKCTHRRASEVRQFDRGSFIGHRLLA
jgi:hypothetical protein